MAAPKLPDVYPSYYGHGDAEELSRELRVYECRKCRRLFPIIARAHHPKPDVQDGFILNSMIGKNHFARHRGSWELCDGPPVIVDRPDCQVAYRMGGPEAVEAMCPGASLIGG